MPRCFRDTSKLAPDNNTNATAWQAHILQFSICHPRTLGNPLERLPLALDRAIFLMDDPSTAMAKLPCSCQQMQPLLSNAYSCGTVDDRRCGHLPADSGGPVVADGKLIRGVRWHRISCFVRRLAPPPLGVWLNLVTGVSQIREREQLSLAPLYFWTVFV
jgi:hypothetical protein